MLIHKLRLVYQLEHHRQDIPSNVSFLCLVLTAAAADDQNYEPIPRADRYSSLKCTAHSAPGVFPFIISPLCYDNMFVSSLLNHGQIVHRDLYVQPRLLVVLSVPLRAWHVSLGSDLSFSHQRAHHTSVGAFRRLRAADGRHFQHIHWASVRWYQLRAEAPVGTTL